MVSTPNRLSYKSTAGSVTVEAMFDLYRTQSRADIPPYPVDIFGCRARTALLKHGGWREYYTEQALNSFGVFLQWHC